MYKILSIKIPLILFLALYSGSSITHENINHNIHLNTHSSKCSLLTSSHPPPDQAGNELQRYFLI